MMTEYEIIVFWGEADNVFIAEMPELKGCLAHGETQDEALRKANAVAAEWLQMAKGKGCAIPQPKGRLLFV